MTKNQGGSPDLDIRPVIEEDIRGFAEWRYEPPYEGHNITQPVDEAIEYFLRPSTNCHVLVRAGELAAFFTFGADARVPGGDYSAPALDIGLGMRPSLTGQGLGRSFVEAVIQFARDNFSVDQLRVTIDVKNTRAIRVWSRQGFEETQRFKPTKPAMGADLFVVLEKPA